MNHTHPTRQSLGEFQIKLPVIPGLTDHLSKLGKTELSKLLKKLRDSAILDREHMHSPDTLDCHPLVREHFGEKLQKNNPKAWKEAHSRLYEYYKELPEKEYPDTLEEMEPLFAAVAHGCQANLHTKTWEEVFWPKIRRGNVAFSIHKLGAIGAELSALSNFFEILWYEPISGFSDHRKAILLNSAGFLFRALGRLREAIQPMQSAMQKNKVNKNWVEAAANTANLSEIFLTLGEIKQAKIYASQGVEYINHTNNWSEKRGHYTNMANALHQAGELLEAEKLCKKAEDLQKSMQPKCPLLYSVEGFYLCDLLLSQGNYQEVQQRVRQTLEWMINDPDVPNLMIALDNLSLGRAFLLQNRNETNKNYAEAEEYLNKAITDLQKCNRQDYLPRALMTRVTFYRMQLDFPHAWDDLMEALEIAERGGMKLWLVDYYLEAGRVVIGQLSVDSDQVAVDGFQLMLEGRKVTLNREEMVAHLIMHVDKAAELVQETGYHRRDPEILLLQTQLALAKGEKQTAQEWLKKAKDRFDEMGIRMWDWEVRELEEKLK